MKLRHLKARHLKALVLGSALAGTLSACVDPMLTEATKSPQPAAAPAPEAPPVIPEELKVAYSAKQDGKFNLPAIPVEQVPAGMRRQEVAFETADAPGTIIINPAAKTLHLVTAPGRAMRYGIAVGKDGFQWAGEAIISGRRQWPTWTPPPEMIDRKPELEKWKDGQPGGLTNPLGARALYLTTGGVDYGFRIHGTPEWKSIGRNASSGCFRMINQDVIDLYSRVPDGVKVVVLNADGTRPTKLKLPPPAPKKKKPAPEPKPELTPAVAPATPATPAVPGGALGAPAPGFPAMTAPVATAPMIGGLPPLPAVPPALAPAPAAVVTPAPAAASAPVVTPEAPAADTPPAAAPAACVPGAGITCP